MISKRNLFIISAIVIAAVTRIIPHLPNFTAVAAMALFGGATLKDKRLAFAAPIVAMFLSDIALQFMFGYGFHNTMLYVYAGIVLTTFVGTFLQNKLQVVTLTGASLVSSVIFFLLTNFGVWMATTQGETLMETYVLGIPFFGYSVFGDLVYTAVLFGLYQLAAHRYPELIEVKK